MSEITFSTYDRIMSTRPFKLDGEEVNYRKAEGEEACEKCAHFFSRVVDGWKTCELVRDVKTDDDETPIKPDYVCDFFNVDGKTFPLYEAMINETVSTDE